MREGRKKKMVKLSWTKPSIGLQKFNVDAVARGKSCTAGIGI